MRVEICDSEKKVKEEPIRLALREIEDGRIHIVVVDENGKPDNFGGILGINNDGTFSRCTCLDSDLGFQCDEKGRIIEGSRRSD